MDLATEWFLIYRDKNKFVELAKDLNVKRFKNFQKKKLEQKIPYSRKEKLIDKDTLREQ